MQKNRNKDILKPVFYLVVQFIFMTSFYSNLGADEAAPRKLPLYPYVYLQDFESEDPFRKWKSNGSFKVRYKGLTYERSSSGKRSFKLDIRFDTATYVYWEIPLSIPCEGELEFKADIYLSAADHASAALGVNIDLAPFPRSGITLLPRQDKVTGRWTSQGIDLIEAGQSKAEVQTAKYLGEGAPGDVGRQVNKIGLFLFGKKGSSITVYIDKMMIKGRIPDPEAYQAKSKTAWQAYKTRIDTEIDRLVNTLGNVEPHEVNTLLAPYANRGYIFARELAALKLMAADLPYRIDYWHNNQDLITFPIDPITPRKILPHMYPVPAFPGSSLRARACPGEVEPASFVIRAEKPIHNIKIFASDFLSKTGDLLGPEAVDIRLVKSWYQAGDGDVVKEGRSYLTPELLVKDDALIQNHIPSRKSFLKTVVNKASQYIDISHENAVIPENAFVFHSPLLLPFDLDENENRQVWLSISIPKDSQPGQYSGEILIQGESDSGRSVSKTLEMEILVLDFTLPPPCLEVSIFYTGKLVTHPVGLTSEYKSPSQYRHEMTNLKSHGISSATIYQQLDKKPEAALEIRSQAGISGKNLYVIGTQTSNPVDIEPLNRLRADVMEWQKHARSFDYTHLYIYGIDEAGPDLITSQIKAWETVHQAGAGIFVACPKDAVDAAGSLLNIGILNRSLNPEAAKKFHKNGTRVFSYGNPQIGVENPELYRQNYGLDLWIAGYDGAMNFAYQYEMGEIWNDFDHPRFRDHVFAYPVTNGVIDTVQWEGFREGIDDLRYLTLLLQLDPAPDTAIREWLIRLKQEGLSMRRIRDLIIQRIKQHL